MDTNLEPKPTRRHNGRLVAGTILIVIGAVTLLQSWLDIGNYITLLLGVGMLILGCATRRGGWIIPGGVLTGIGLGILVSEGPWHFPGMEQNGVFLLCFAFGWFLITALTYAFTNCTQWWALIPGGIMAVIGAILVVTHGNIRWENLNMVYAVILITVGLVLLFSRGRSKKNGEQGQ